MGQPWNHSTHYHPLLLRLLPATGTTALDVGCGDGTFAALLARRFASVVALDPDAVQAEAARARCAALPNVSVRQTDFLGARLPNDSFDVVTALASFHHLPFQDAAAEARRVLRPGGRLVVLGVWTDSRSARGLALTLVSTVVHLVLRLRRGKDRMTAPATLERTAWREVRADVAQHLPGARLRRHLLWRCTVVWDEPGQDLT